MSHSEVLDFWFVKAEAPRGEWFRKDEAFDELIRERFGSTIDAALDGSLDAWHDAGDAQALARILVLDQFTRNVFRGSARAFAGDAKALAASQSLIASGRDRRLPPLQRLFVVLPLEHSEKLADQHACLAQMQALGRDEPTLADYAQWAQKHLDVIQRFGRFPHRNAALGRASTAAEIEFLQQPGSSF